MSDYEPTPGEPYGRCTNCGFVADTEDDAAEHQRQTLDAALARGESRSHSVRITNPPRGIRIRGRVCSIVEDAIERAMADLDRMVDRGTVTEAEVSEALRNWPGFGDFRDEWIEDAS